LEDEISDEGLQILEEPEVFANLLLSMVSSA